jgi:hypothetical protein
MHTESGQGRQVNEQTADFREESRLKQIYGSMYELVMPGERPAEEDVLNGARSSTCGDIENGPLK